MEDDEPARLTAHNTLPGGLRKERTDADREGNEDMGNGTGRAQRSATLAGGRPRGG